MDNPSQFTINDDVTIFVEFPTEAGGFRETSRSSADFAQKSAEALQQAMDSIHHMANRVSIMIDKISDRPSQVEVSFGIKFNSEVGAVIAVAGMECSIDVKLIWENKDMSTKPGKGH
jgi:hypothetical protein